ncbi:MAG: CBS domain-containing protein, partial [Woeseiaceae bacterium]
MRDIAINRIMTTDPATVDVNDPISAAKQIFEVGDIHHLPVTQDGLLVGIVSSSDMLKFHLLSGDPAELSIAKVSQVMEPDPMVLDSGATLRDAATTLTTGGYHALPVVEQGRVLVGIVTTVDLVTHLLHQIPRHDGSLRDSAQSESAASASDQEISHAVRKAEEATQRADDPEHLSRVLLHFRTQNQLLEHVRKAAELYLRSGHGEHEHSVLVKRLADIGRQ